MPKRKAQGRHHSIRHPNKRFSCYGRRRTGVKPASSCLFLCMTLLMPTAMAQKAQELEMPMFLVEGGSYTRQSFDENGDLVRSQKMEISRLNRQEEALEVQVTLYNDAENGQSSDAISTTVRCQAREANMVMNVLALIQPDGKRIAVRMISGKVLYPSRPTAPVTLEDIVLEAQVLQGVPGILDGKSVLHFRNRSLQPSAASPTAGGHRSYTITEDLRVRIYTLGIKVRDRTYRIEETIQPDLGLVRHILTSPDGGYVSLDRVD